MAGPLAGINFYLERRFQYTPRQTSYLFSYIGVLMVFVQGGLVRRLVPRLGERRLVIAGTLFMALGLFLQAYIYQAIFLFVAIAIVAIGNGLNSPSLTSLISREASSDEQGGVLGVAQAFSALARIIGPMAGTWALRYGEGAPYIFGGAILSCACLVALFRIRDPQTKVQSTARRGIANGAG